MIVTTQEPPRPIPAGPKSWTIISGHRAGKWLTAVEAVEVLRWSDAKVRTPQGTIFMGPAADIELLAGETELRIGVDLWQVDRPGNTHPQPQTGTFEPVIRAADLVEQAWPKPGLPLDVLMRARDQLAGQGVGGDLQFVPPPGWTQRDVDEYLAELIRRYPPADVAADTLPPRRRRLRACVERWPDAETCGYDPRCCRFPKSCSADVYTDGAVADADLEPDPNGDK